MSQIPINRSEDAEPFSFIFHTPLGDSQVDIPFNFRQHPILPGRINALTGSCGSGKTTVLQNLAAAARREPTNSSFSNPPPFFGNTVTFSSDTLNPLPEPQGEPPLTFDAEIRRNISLMQQLMQYENVQQTISPLSQHPSFTDAGNNPIDPGDTDLNQWPTGHKLACSLLTIVSGGLGSPGSLALLDQPEALLHPSLQATVMAALQTALDYTDSYAIIATTSPAILQEIPASQVHVLRRSGATTRVERPSIETYGETPGLILRHVLDLNPDRQRFMSTLRTLASRMTMPEINNMFPQGLSSQARAFLTQLEGPNPNPLD